MCLVNSSQRQKGDGCAGKTTLLDVLAGRRRGKNVVGQVTMNGKPCGPEFRRISGYVPQEDSFVATLTALETLNFRAALTLPADTSKAARTERIKAVLETMGLWRVRDSKVRHFHSPSYPAHMYWCNNAASCCVDLV